MMATAYPSVNFILPHMGSYGSGDWTQHISAIDLCKRFPNLYLETSGVVNHKYLELAAQELPAEKILFGSFSPEADPRIELYAIKLLKLPSPAEAQVLGGNIAHLLRL